MTDSKRISIRVLAFFCCIAVAFSFMLPYDTAYAATTLGDQPETFKAEELTGDLMGQEVPLAKKYQDMIDYYMIKDGPVYKGSGQCWGYAEMMRKRFGSGGGKTVSLNKKATKKSVYNALKDVKPGTHLRMKYPDSSMHHSICVFKVTKKMIYYAEGNADGGGNGIRYRITELQYFPFLDCKMEFYIEPTGSYYSKSTTPKAVTSNLENKTTLIWQPIKNAKSYTIYRSYSKTGTYKKIGTSTHPRYVDKTANFGVVYYKVKAGSYKTAATRVYHKLLSSDVTLTHNAKGYAVLSWDKVKGASKYKIYKVKYTSSGEKLTLLKTVTKPEYTYAYTGSWNKDLLVKAVYSKNSKCNSEGTYVWGPLRVAPKPKIKEITYEKDDWGDLEAKIGIKTLYVNKKGSYLYVDLYRSDKKNGDYYYVGGTCIYDTSDSSAPKMKNYTTSKLYYVDDWYISPGSTYYYKAVCYNDAGQSIESSVFKFTYPEEDTETQE